MRDRGLIVAILAVILKLGQPLLKGKRLAALPRSSRATLLLEENPYGP
jgi:hypothetical protein